MTAKGYRLRLQHILEAVGDIRTITDGKKVAEIECDRVHRLALERSFEIISEASRHLPDELKDRHPEIPWKKVAGIGNIIRHAYDGVEPDLLLTIVRET